MRPTAPGSPRQSRNPIKRPAIHSTAALVFALLWLGMAGCGYRFAGRAAGLGELESAAVVTLENESVHPEVALAITESIRRELLARGTLRLVSDPAKADLVVEGRVPNFRIESQTVSSIAGALEYSVSIPLRVRVSDPSGESFAIPSLTAEVLYLASADIEVTRKNRVEAFRRIGDILAVRIWDSIELRYTQ